MTRGLSFWGITAALFLFLLLTVHPVALAEENAKKDLPGKVEQLEKKVDQLSAKDASYDYLKEETRAYREFVEKEWDRFLTWFFGIVGIFGIILVFFNQSSKKEIKVAVMEQLRAKVEEELNHETARLKLRISELEGIANKESWFQNSKILALDRGNLQSIFSSSPLNKNEIKYDAPPFNRLPQLLAQRKVDIIVYEYDTESEDQRDPDLAYLLKQLERYANSSMPLPVVIYTKGRSVNNEEMNELLGNYQWYTFANNRITLVSNTYGLTHAYYSKGK